jgi:anti-anti-sigma regulatory factor
VPGVPHLPPGEFWADVVDDGTTCTIVCHGDLDIATASQFRALSWPLSGSDLTLDLRPLDLVDSSGLREIVRLRDRLRPAHRLTLLARTGSVPWHLIRLASLAELLQRESG